MSMCKLCKYHWWMCTFSQKVLDIPVLSSFIGYLRCEFFGNRKLIHEIVSGVEVKVKGLNSLIRTLGIYYCSFLLIIASVKVITL
jgi:hypothetical protein